MKLPIMCAALLLVFAGATPVMADAPLKKRSVSLSCSPVEMFVTSWCGYCKMLERILDKKGISYTTYDIEKDDSAARIFHKLGGRGVPLIRVGSKVVYGYDPETVISYADCN